MLVSHCGTSMILRYVKALLTYQTVATPYLRLVKTRWNQIKLLCLKVSMLTFMAIEHFDNDALNVQLREIVKRDMCKR